MVLLHSWLCQARGIFETHGILEGTLMPQIMIPRFQKLLN